MCQGSQIVSNSAEEMYGNILANITQPVMSLFTLVPNLGYQKWYLITDVSRTASAILY